MKSKIICALASVVVLTIGCRPINPPQSEEEVTKIIEILYNGIGKNADVSLKQLSAMGIDLVFIEPNDDDFDEGYFIKTDNYVISIASLHDSVLYAYYKYEFKNTFVEGIKEFHKSDNTVHKFDWEYWQGGYKQEYSDISDHAIANQKIDSCVAENNTSSCCVSSYYQAPFSDKYLFSTVSYNAWSVGGMDPDTGLGQSRLAESAMFIDFGVRTSPVLPSVRPELN